jgi:membrane protein YqaA with SNARE-associated domain
MQGIWWVAFASYAVAVASALLPWVNAEVLMLAVVPAARTPCQLGVLVALVTLGQMTGKSIIFWMSRRATIPRAARLQKAVDAWRRRLSEHPRSAVAVMLASATLGVPPFYIVAMAAGALDVAFGRFLAIGTACRLVHFALVALSPHLIWRNV